MAEAKIAKFLEPLDFPQIMFKQIMKVMDSAEKRDAEAFIVNVEMLENLLTPWIDKEYKDKCNGTSDKTWTVNKKEYNFTRCRECEERFEQQMKLICRCGFLPERKVEGVLDEDVIAALHKSIT